VCSAAAVVVVVEAEEAEEAVVADQPRPDKQPNCL
jgi:hypothetical protein